MCVACTGSPVKAVLQSQPFIRAAVVKPGDPVNHQTVAADFVGSATCAARSRVVPSLFIVGGGLTDAKALVNHGWDQTRIRFPVVATF